MQGTLGRLVAKLDIAGPDACWLWTGCKLPTGHGRLGVRGKVKLVHRIAYEAWVGPIPVGLCVRHTCDVANCCNPAHLAVGTWADNVADRGARGRGRWHSGETHHNSQLTDEQAVFAMARLVFGEKPKVVAEHFSVKPGVVYQIWNGITRAHLFASVGG